MPQFNMYTDVHKGLRNLLFSTALSAGNTDWNSETSLAALRERMERLLHTLRLHVHNEETYVHPLLAERLIGVHRKLEAAHREQEELLDDLEALFRRALTADTEQRGQLGLECYRVLNRFLALYLPHLDDEEARVMLMLNEAFTQEELTAVFLTILRSQTEYDILDDVDMMFPAMTDGEVAKLLQTGPSWMSQELIGKASQRAEQAMGAGRWGQVMSRMEAATAR